MWSYSLIKFKLKECNWLTEKVAVNVGVDWSSPIPITPLVSTQRKWEGSVYLKIN